MFVCEFGPQPGRCATCGGWTTRLCCSPACAREYAAQHRWGQARSVALARAGYECEDCGTPDWDVALDVHHLDPVDDYEPGCQHHQDNLRVLCQPCHRLTHQRMRAKPGTQLRLPVLVA